MANFNARQHKLMLLYHRDSGHTSFGSVRLLFQSGGVTVHLGFNRKFCAENRRELLLLQKCTPVFVPAQTFRLPVNKETAEIGAMILACGDSIVHLLDIGVVFAFFLIIVATDHKQTI
jgi:hypothetical protein